MTQCSPDDQRVPKSDSFQNAAQGKTVDASLLVASSRSFAAVSRESFYVGISRARESVQVFTDDAELLVRRMEDTHTRKAALELQGLRDELAKHRLGHAKEAEQNSVAVEIKSESEGISRISRALLPMRAQALAPVLVVQKWTQDFKQWVGQKLGPHKAREIQPTVKQDWSAVQPNKRSTRASRSLAATGSNNFTLCQPPPHPPLRHVARTARAKK